MPYNSSQDIVNDALFRVGEIPGSSEWDAKALDYLNAVYRGLCAGSSEFLPEFVEDWWWLRGSGAFNLNPVYTTGTVSVANGSTTVTFTDAPPSISPDTWRLKVDGTPDIFVYDPNTGEIDTAYTGDTNATAVFTLMRLEYTLPASVQVLMSPMMTFKRDREILGTTPERMNELFPLRHLRSGVPMAFALEGEQVVRFSHGGLEDGSMRVEYTYRPVVDDLTNSAGSIPLLPLQYRHLLSYMVAVYLYTDKNDNRATAAGSAARAGLVAMAKENRRRLAKIDRNVGRLLVRPSQTLQNAGRAYRSVGYDAG